MHFCGVLACGPTPGLLLYLGAIAAGGLGLTVSFVVGFLCLFTSKWKLGIWLTSVPLVIAAVIYCCGFALDSA
jgi:hypothetical protein